jgi:non-ribosomal peptide synthetase component E (peptide arylation enzyme)
VPEPHRPHRRLYSALIAPFLLGDAFVVTGGRDLTLDEVVAHFTERGVAKQKTPERLEIVPSSPGRSPARSRSTC